jgi:hypothetical protein
LAAIGGRRVVPILIGLFALGTARAAESRWNLSASAYYYFVPDDVGYLQPTFAADRERLHLEARYNYEGLDTGSMWIGYNLHASKEVSFDFTPMLAGVFGDLDGIAPGFEATLDWRSLGLYSEGEYVLSTSNNEDPFYYSWSEATISPVGWLHAGLVGQRTRAYESPREFQRGILAGLNVRHAEITGYVFNPDESNPLWVLAARAEF